LKQIAKNDETQLKVQSTEIFVIEPHGNSFKTICSFFELYAHIQYFTAIENDQEIIITRNQSDFKYSKIPVMTAGEFLKSI